MKRYAAVIAAIVTMGSSLALAQEKPVGQVIERSLIPEVGFRHADPVDAIVFLVNCAMHPATNKMRIGLNATTNDAANPQWEPDFVIVNVSDEKRLPITLFRHNTTVKHVIDAICKTRGLKYEVVANRIMLSNAEVAEDPTPRPP